MSFFKTINNTNGAQMSDLDTITLRNSAITSALIPYDTISLRNTAITDMDTISLRNTALIPYDTIALRNTAITTNNTSLLASSNIFSGTNTFSSINTTNLNLLTSTSQNVRYGFEAALGSILGSNITAIGHQCIKGWISGNFNTAVGSSITGIGGSSNTMIGYGSGSSGNFDFSSCFGVGASITRSNQIALGRISETVQTRGGFATSCNSITASVTLANPILSNYICINGINNIIITLPLPLENGVNLMIRRGASSTGTININATIFPVNSITSISSLSLINTSSFVYYENAWYQTTSF